ncbi:MAG: molybdopterin-dependent oxidoreductase [Acidiferrobacterales bacterium]
MKASLGASASVLLHSTASPLIVSQALAAAVVPSGLKPLPSGTLLGTVPFVGEGNFPLETIVGSGLSGRLVTDLSKLSAETLITPNYQFFIRTRYPDRLRPAGDWKILVRGLVETPVQLSLNELMQEEGPMGVHLVECAGNMPTGGFGLISTARWSGIPMARILEKVKVRPQATRVIVSGFDEHSQPAPGAIAGASWVFRFEQLEAAGAFLATGMNRLPLPKDHGYPVRFIMPGWYGCTCIKWVNQILLADDSAPATGHMKEYASRTHQDGMPKLAKDFRPATIDLVAMPIRIEQWRVGGRLVYRVVGILWGGNKLTDTLMIRFNADMPYVPVRDYDHETNATWTVWSYTWRPKVRGRYPIQLKVADPSIRTRRLDSGFYVRTVDIAAT